MEKIELQNRKGQKIVGVLEKPEGEAKGTAVLQHGWGSNKDKPTIQAIKKGFINAGFQTFNFDATNASGESDGDYEKSTLGLHWEDLEDVVVWLKKQVWALKPLALSGHSKGGYSVVRYVEEHPGDIDYLIPVAPVVSGKLSFDSHMKRDSEGFNKWKKDGVLITERDGVSTIKHWFQMSERLDHDLLVHAGKITIPTLFIVGSKDESCPSEHVQLLADKIISPSKEFHIISEAPHSFYQKSEQNECTEVITTWLKKVMP